MSELNDTIKAELLSALLGLVEEIEDLINGSHGVAGFHRNGDLAPWSELEPGGQYECLSHLSRARSVIAKATGE